MKKLLLTLVIFVAAASTACGKGLFSDDKPIAFNQLPSSAREFIATHFPAAKVALTTVERELWSPSYEVIFTDGTTIEFLSSGEWKNVDCKYTRLPEGILPTPILAYIKQNHPDNFATEIDRDNRRYEVNLNNHLDLHFTLSGQFRGYDD
jgi:hypothetical protein